MDTDDTGDADSDIGTDVESFSQSNRLTKVRCRLQQTLLTPTASRLLLIMLIDDGYPQYLWPQLVRVPGLLDPNELFKTWSVGSSVRTSTARPRLRWRQ